MSRRTDEASDIEQQPTYLPLLLTAAVVSAAMATHRPPPQRRSRRYQGRHLA